MKCNHCDKELGASFYKTTTGKYYCDETCKKAFFSASASRAMARTNKRDASARMLERNPMHRPEIREKVSATHKANGHAPKERGGNGRGPTKQQARLAEALGMPCEVIVPTKLYGKGYPSNYKLDIGNTILKLGIEIDGSSHNTLARQAQDRKKEEFFESIGWKIVRFKNKEVDNDIDACVATVRSLLASMG